MVPEVSPALEKDLYAGGADGDSVLASNFQYRGARWRADAGTECG